MAKRSGGLFVLGTFDRCSGAGIERQCMRWAQVVVRDEGRFTGGYLPNHQVARIDRWRRSELPLPRAQLIKSTIEGEGAGARAVFVLVARALDNQLHRKTLTHPALNGGYPPAHMKIHGQDQEAIIEFEGSPPLHVELRGDMDLRRLTP